MSPPRVRRQYAHAWAPADLLLDRLAAWPSGLLTFWLAAPAGHVVFSATASAYLPAAMPWHGRDLQAVARISLADLLGEGRPAQEVIAHLVDHLLGSRGATGGRWLSDGAGATAALTAVAGRVSSLASLGYGPDEPHAYFAWAFSRFWLDRQALNAADPLIERLLRTTICNEAFWTGATAGHE